MGRPLHKDNDYDERLLKFIIQYTRDNKVSPTFRIILDNLEDIHSKSSLYFRLQKLISEGLIIQKNDKGCYFPTSLNQCHFIGNWEINRIMELSQDSKNFEDIKKILLSVSSDK